MVCNSRPTPTFLHLHTCTGLRQSKGRNEYSSIERGIASIADVESKHELPGVRKDRCDGDWLGDSYECCSDRSDKRSNTKVQARVAGIPSRKS